MQQPADYFADKPSPELQPLNTKWEGPYTYEPPGGVLAKDWFVWLKYQHPITGKFERFKFYYGFAKLKTKELRRQHARALKEVINTLLKEGWSPFEEYNVLKNQEERRVTALITNYLKVVETGLRPSSYKKYKSELTLFQKWLIASGHINLRIDAVKKNVIITFLNENKEERKWSAKTYNDYLNDITTFFNYYHNNFDEYIDKVPTKSLTRQKVTKKGNLAWSDWQFKKLKEMMNENGDHLLYIFCSFIYYAALRNESEGNYIRAGDFNFKTKTLKIDSGTAKNRTTEYIPLYPDFLDLLYELKVPAMDPGLYIFGKNQDYKNIPRSEFVIGGLYPLGQDFFAAAFRPYKQALNIPKEEHGIYRYKHTRAVHLGEDGEDLYKIMKLFRHKDLATTMIYMRGLGVDTQNTEFKKGRKF